MCFLHRRTRLLACTVLELCHGPGRSFCAAVDAMLRLQPPLCVAPSSFLALKPSPALCPCIALPACCAAATTSRCWAGPLGYCQALMAAAWCCTPLRQLSCTAGTPQEAHTCRCLPASSPRPWVARPPASKRTMSTKASCSSSNSRQLLRRGRPGRRCSSSRHPTCTLPSLPHSTSSTWQSSTTTMPSSCTNSSSSSSTCC